jgi:hypothetical protein
MMRAKMKVLSVTTTEAPGETIKFSAVCKSGSYPADGTDEDNSFAKWTPSATLEMYISNPALLGKIKPGQKFYLDFTEAP